VKKIALLTDSSCDLPKNLIEKFGVNIIPLHIIYKATEYRDGIDITPEEIYERMPAEIPTTSMPSVGETWDLILKLKEEGYTHILAILISSGLSGTFSMVESMKEKIKELGISVTVIDSKALSMGLGFLVIKAGKLIQDKVPMQDIINKVKTLQKEIKVFFVLKTLEYLKKGGRIGLVEGTIGDILDIKPIISINEQGVYCTIAKSRGRSRSLNKIIEIAKEAIGNRKVHLAVMNSASIDEANEVLEKLKNEVYVAKIFTGQIGPGMGVHTGPGLIGICFCPA